MTPDWMFWILIAMIVAYSSLRAIMEFKTARFQRKLLTRLSSDTKEEK